MVKRFVLWPYFVFVLSICHCCLGCNDNGPGELDNTATAEPVRYYWQQSSKFFDEHYDSCIYYCKLVDSLARLQPYKYADYIVRANTRWADQLGNLDDWGRQLDIAEQALYKYGDFLDPDSLMHSAVLLRYDRCRWIDSGGDYDRALACYKRLWKDLPEHLPDEQNFRVTLPLSIGWVLYVKGDYKSAIEWLGQARRYIPDDHYYYPGYFYDFLGKAYFGLGDYKNAEENFRRSIEAFSMNRNLAIMDNSAVEAYTDLVNLYIHTSQYDSCLAVLSRARRLDIRKDWNFSLLHYQFANTYHSTGQYRKALAHIDTALVYLDSMKAGRFYLKGRYLSFQGKMMTDHGAYPQAMDAYRDALKHLIEPSGHSGQPGDIDPEASSAKLDLLTTLSRKARTLQRLSASGANGIGYLRDALGTYETAIDLIRLLRTDYPDDETKELLSRQWFEVFESAVETAMMLNEQTGREEFIEDAFYYCETGKALSLLENLKDLEAKEYTGIPPHVVEEEFAFRRQIGHLEKTWREAEDDGEQQVYRDSLFVVKRKYEQWQEGLRNTFPSYFQLKFNAEVVTLDQIRRSLAKGETLVEYFYGNEKVYAFAISRDGVKTHAFPNTPAFNEDRRRFVSLSRSYRGLQSVRKIRDFQKAGCRLYHQLVEPLDLEADNVIFIPDGPLHYLPFAALTTDTIWRDDPGKLPYLIYDYTISNNFSASVRFQQKKNERAVQATMPLLILSPERFPRDNNLKIEPEKLETRFHGNVKLVRNPTKRQTVELLRSGFRNIFIFTHAAAHEEGPFLQLYEDTLFLSELYATPVDAGLVLLGACETGLGENSRGEGVLSIARGFAYQNVPNTIMTLWRVQESAALEISLDFLDLHLNDGFPPAIALRKAQLSFLKKPGQIGYPFLWAGFVAVGD